MERKLEVSFNSPQCGWMSIGFDDGVNEFHTTTAHAPHESALPELLQILTKLLINAGSSCEFTLKWNRDPEEFDFVFLLDGWEVTVFIHQYPTDERDSAESELVFCHAGTVANVCAAFAATFEQLYADRETDEFEFNWRQPFPLKEYSEFNQRLLR